MRYLLNGVMGKINTCDLVRFFYKRDKTFNILVRDNFGNLLGAENSINEKIRAVFCEIPYSA